MDTGELVAQLIAFARYEEFGPKRNLMRAAAEVIAGYMETEAELELGPALDPDDVAVFLESRGITLLKWQLDRLASGSVEG